jgi:hypothetical protein
MGTIKLKEKIVLLRQVQGESATFSFYRLRIAKVYA